MKCLDTTPVRFSPVVSLRMEGRRYRRTEPKGEYSQFFVPLSFSRMKREYRTAELCKKGDVMERNSISCFKKRLVFMWIVPLLLVGMYQTYVFGGKAPVEKTGQITSYSETGGEDGDLRKGVKWPNPRFTDKGNGTVKDNLTNLIWLKDANAFGLRTWEQALSDANALASGTAGLTDDSKAGDWRLPNRNELISLIDVAYNSPALSSASGKSHWTSGDAFIGVQSDGYWSSTTYSYDAMAAWFVSLGDGGVYHVNKYFYYTFSVWPVRAGQ